MSCIWHYYDYQIQLPSKQVITHHVTLNEEEQCVFDLLFVQCRYSAGTVFVCVLCLLLCLLLCLCIGTCVHMYVVCLYNIF